MGGFHGWIPTSRVVRYATDPRKISRQLCRSWLVRQFPGNTTVWGCCEYLFDPNAREYDWLVVYNDFPGNLQEERLSCPRQHTLLVTCEPSSIKTYGRAYTAQFGFVLTSQAEWALPHEHRIYSQPALQWFYGLGGERLRTYDQMVAAPPLDKHKTISTVCSSKRQRHTLHNKRYRFTQALKARIPAMDIYGHGVKAMEDKAEALDDYRYHVAIENHIGIHHWTEKLSDVFLGAALPFYSGCPNATDYFPEESFIPIDIDHVEKAYETIERAIQDREYEKRLPFILEARRRVTGTIQSICRPDPRSGNPHGRPGAFSAGRRSDVPPAPAETESLRCFGGFLRQMPVQGIACPETSMASRRLTPDIVFGTDIREHVGECRGLHDFPRDPRPASNRPRRRSYRNFSNTAA